MNLISRNEIQAFFKYFYKKYLSITWPLRGSCCASSHYLDFLGGKSAKNKHEFPEEKNSQTSFIKKSSILVFCRFFRLTCLRSSRGKTCVARQLIYTQHSLRLHSRDLANFCPKLSKNGQIPPSSRKVAYATTTLLGYRVVCGWYSQEARLKNKRFFSCIVSREKRLLISAVRK